MKKDFVIHIRVSYDFKKLLKNIADAHKITISGLIYTYMNDGMARHDSKVSSKLRKQIENYKLSESITEVSHRMYIKKNMYSRVMDMAMSDFFINGDINMEAIRVIVNLYVAKYETYEEELKKIIGNDFKFTVRQLKNKEYLYNKLENYRKMKLIEKK